MKHFSAARRLAWALVLLACALQGRKLKVRRASDESERLSAGSAERTVENEAAASLALADAEVETLATAYVGSRLVLQSPERLGPAPSLHKALLQRQLLKSLALPLLSTLVGVVMLHIGLHSSALFFLFFGGQSCMTFYMKHVLSESTLSDELHLKGIPAPFFVTACQQLVSFVVLALYVRCTRGTQWQYIPQKLHSLRQVFPVICLAISYVLNIGLNNLSVSLLDISVNMAIRSSTPLFALLIDVTIVRTKPRTWMEICMVVLGTSASCLVILAKSGHGIVEQHSFKFGVLLCFFSVFASAFELILVKQFATNADCKLNGFDTILYVTVPAALLLAPLGFLFPHFIPWSGHASMTDWEVVRLVCKVNPGVFGLVLFSGVLALAYNYLLYALVQCFSPSTAALSSNLNKVLTVTLSLALGLEHLPLPPMSFVMEAGMIASAACFTYIGFLNEKAKK